AFDNDINRFVLQFRNTKDGEITGQIPAGKSSLAYREAQRLRGEQADKAEAKVAGEKSAPETAATPGDAKAPPPIVIGASAESSAPDSAS
ncbi:hypothetical protein ABTH77_20120, partial [Acinetobacter baumannii]